MFCVLLYSITTEDDCLTLSGHYTLARLHQYKLRMFVFRPSLCTKQIILIAVGLLHIYYMNAYELKVHCSA